MKRWLPITVLTVGMCLIPGVSNSFAQQTSTERKVVSKVVPDYPQMARALKLAGVVRVDVVVSPNGSVKSLQVKGGHPVLAMAAAEAVRKWKWVPAKAESTEPVTVRFEPQN